MKYDWQPCGKPFSVEYTIRHYEPKYIFGSFPFFQRSALIYLLSQGSNRQGKSLLRHGPVRVHEWMWMLMAFGTTGKNHFLKYAPSNKQSSLSFTIRSTNGRKSTIIFGDIEHSSFSPLYSFLVCCMGAWLRRLSFSTSISPPFQQRSRTIQRYLLLCSSYTVLSLPMLHSSNHCLCGYCSS